MPSLKKNPTARNMTDAIEKETFPQRWVVRAMKQNNLTLEDLGNMSYERLRSIDGIGPASATAIFSHFHPGIDAGQLPSGETVFNISMKSIERARRIDGTWHHFGASTQEEFDALEISNEDIARFILDKEKEGASHIAQKREERQSDRQEELEERLQAYLEYFDAPTPNDVAALRNLSFLNMRADILQQDLVAHVGATDPTSQKIMEGLNEQIVKVSAETRLLEQALGIGRRKRIEEGDDPLEVLRGAMDDAEWLMEQEIHEVVHRCKDGKVIPIMSIWHYFPTHPHEPFRQQCPNCGEWITVEYKKRGIAISAKDFEIEDILTEARGGEVKR